MNFQWKIEQIIGWPQQGVFQDVVTTVQWSYEATDGQYSAKESGATALQPPTAENFVPLDQLTEQKCVEYVENELQEWFIQDMKTRLKQQIEKQKQAAPVVLPLPWNQVKG